jgi:hypothetical protein
MGHCGESVFVCEDIKDFTQGWQRPVIELLKYIHFLAALFL